MTSAPMSQHKVIEAIRQLGGLSVDADFLPLLTSHRNQIATAVQAADGEGLAAYCTQAVVGALRQSGGTGITLSVRQLRQLLQGGHGDLIVAAAGGCDRRRASLRTELARLASGSQFAAQARAPRPPASGAAGSEPHTPAAPRVQPAHGAARERAAGPVSEGKVAENVAQGLPPRRHDASNVRTITSARTHSQPPDAAVPQYHQAKVHGGKAAAQFSPDENRRQMPTVRLEAAAMANQQARTYGWDKKIALQFTQEELHHVTAMFVVGKIESVRGSSHGENSKKWFEIARQSGQYAGTYKISVGDGEKTYVIQLSSASLGNVISVCLTQCAKQLRLSKQETIVTLTRVSEAVVAAQAARSERGAGRASA